MNCASSPHPCPVTDSLDTGLYPLSPRGTSGERDGERGNLKKKFLLSPALSSLSGEEREKKPIAFQVTGRRARTKSGGTFSSIGNGGEGARRAEEEEFRFMALMRVRWLEVEALHKPAAGARTTLSARTRSFQLADMAVRAPIRHRFMASIRVRFLEVFPPHEPRGRAGCPQPAVNVKLTATSPLTQRHGEDTAPCPPDTVQRLNTRISCSENSLQGCRLSPGCRVSQLHLGLIFSMLLASLLQAVETPSPIQLKDVTRQTGINFVHTDGSSGRRYIVESVASGLATFDFDGDGKIDILFLNGAPLPGSPITTPPPRNALYRNEGGLKFTDVTLAAGLADGSYHLGVCIGDYDNDGYPDIYLNNFGPNILYRNNGNGTFTDVTHQAGVAVGNHVGAGACFLDIDGDGDLDLFVANYVDFTFAKHQTRLVNGHPAYVGPMSYGPVPSILFRNNGDRTFTDISRESGIASRPGTGMGVVCADYDNDGDTDIIVGNDAMANFVWRNDGKGHFEEVGLFLGLAYDLNGVGQGTMGVECGDFDNDGRLDFHMTSYQKQWAILYRNLGGGLFADETNRTGGGTGTYNQVEWGSGLIDFDNDGHRDLFIACGHLQDNVDLWDDTTTYEARNILLANTGLGKFADVSSRSGDGMAVKRSSRGTAFDDLDNDGDIDVVVLNSRKEPTILRNDSPARNHWIQIRLRGTRSNRDGIGARIKIVAGDLTLNDEVHSGRGYQSHYGTYPHFGLGQHTRVDRIEVRWIGGGTDVLEGVKVDHVLQITEGSSRP